MANQYFTVFIFLSVFFIFQTDEDKLYNLQSSFDKLQRIQELRIQSNDGSKNPDERISLAEQALSLSKKLDVDTTLLLSSRNLAFQYMIYGRQDKHRDISYFNLKLSQQLNDSLALAYTYDNLGYNYFADRKSDSSYYFYSLALKYYEDLNIQENRVRVLIDMAKIFQNEKDYIGSDEFLIEGLSILNTTLETQQVIRRKRSIYDILAQNAQFLENYTKAIEYYEKSLDLVNKLEDGFEERMLVYNNMAWTYRVIGDYDKALDLLYKVYNENRIFEIDPPFYPLILTNIAYTKHLKGDASPKEIQDLFNKAYKVSHNLDDEDVSLNVAIDMAKYYKDEQKQDSVKKYAIESYNSARKMSENEILLESMMLLSSVEDGQKSMSYLTEYIQLNDSILKKERSARNKFARIKFETDEIEKENAKIAEQRKWLILIITVLILTSLLIYIIITQRAKNKELQFIQDQQRSNEEIYNLLLSQQDKVDEARAMEKKRISQEIHDGILGRMFGVRLSLDSLNFTSGPEAIKSRFQYISELKNIEEDMRKVSHELNTDFVSGSGFIGILEDLISKQTSAYQLEYKFEYSDDIHWENVTNKVKINFYRIIQEALQNIYKHAEAQKVWISIFLKNNVIWLNIRDDGKGFDSSHSKKGIGLKNITSRIKEIDGKVKFQSILNEGTSVEIEVPYKS